MKSYSQVAQERGIRPLSNEIYNQCLKIPVGGLPILTYVDRVLGNTKPFYAGPLGIDSFGNTSYEECVGYYGTNNSCITFVDDQGNTYVSPHVAEIKEALENAGYEDTCLAVFLSNGETLADPELASTWEILCQSVSHRL